MKNCIQRMQYLVGCWIFQFVLLISAEETVFVNGTEGEYLYPTNTTSERNPRFSLLQFVSPLTTADSCNTTTGLSGSCRSAKDCTKRSGRGVETCAWGLGVCCVYTASCGEVTSANVTYFTNPGHPSTTTQSGICSVSVTSRKFAKICQLKLDFEDFTMAGPDQETGMCSTDLFVVSGQDLNNVVPVVCGENAGQHMYIQVGSNSGPYRLTVTTSGDTFERKWKIRITQIECASQANAPPHCLQYHTGAIGRLRSFNFGNTRATEVGYPVNLNYAICIRKEAAMCAATFTRDGNFGVDVARTGSSCQLGDYLSIGTTRICGDNTAIEDTGLQYVNSGPMIITFVSDSIHSINDVGFSMRYTQSACSIGR